MIKFFKQYSEVPTSLSNASHWQNSLHEDILHVYFCYIKLSLVFTFWGRGYKWIGSYLVYKQPLHYLQILIQRLLLLICTKRKMSCAVKVLMKYYLENTDLFCLMFWTFISEPLHLGFRSTCFNLNVKISIFKKVQQFLLA